VAVVALFFEQQGGILLERDRAGRFGGAGEGTAGERGLEAEDRVARRYFFRKPRSPSHSAKRTCHDETGSSGRSARTPKPWPPLP